jgi:ribosomal protein S18
VLQAEQREQATVLLVQVRSPHNLVKAVTTTGGKFQFDGVAPGDYALLAIDEADQMEYASPEVLKRYLSAAAHISLQPHATASVSLTVSPTNR